MAENEKNILENIGEQEYKYGFTTDIETETIGKGLSEEVVRLISAKKGEPEWMTERRVAAYRHWLTLEPPTWAHLTIPPIDFQDIIYYAAPKPKKQLGSMDEVDPELKRTFDKLGIPLEEQMALAGVAVDAVMDSVSVKTTFKEVLAEKGIVFCSISEALRDFPELVKKYLGSVVPYTDNFYAALNAAVFSCAACSFFSAALRSSSSRWISAWASTCASARIFSFSLWASCTSLAAIFWAVSSAWRMASSVERYSSTFSASTFSLAFRAALSLYRAV